MIRFLIGVISKMKINSIREKLEKNKPYIYKHYRVKNIGIFGSHVRGEGKEDSDIDILVQFDKGHKGFFNYMRLKYYLEGIIGKEVDLVMKDAVKPGLKEKIFREVQYV